MTIKEIYEIWNFKGETEEIQTQRAQRYHEIINSIRKSNRTWSFEDIEIFKAYLEHNEKKWFVMSLFSKLESIPEPLFEPFILAAIQEPNPSANRYFIEPCLRVFGFESVFKSLDTYFTNGDNPTKIEVCKAYYWARSPLVRVSTGDGPWEVKGFKLKWNGQYYSNYDKDNETRFEMTESEIAECKKVLLILRAERRKILIQEFLNNQNTDVRYQIKLCLPKNIDEFTTENRALASLYFKALSNDFVPENYSDLQLKKRLGCFGNNKLIKFFLKKKNERIEKKGLITLKNK